LIKIFIEKDENFSPLYIFHLLWKSCRASPVS
jgi:hypothetical protein